MLILPNFIALPKIRSPPSAGTPLSAIATCNCLFSPNFLTSSLLRSLLNLHFSSKVLENFVSLFVVSRWARRLAPALACDARGQTPGSLIGITSTYPQPSATKLATCVAFPPDIHSKLEISSCSLRRAHLDSLSLQARSYAPTTDRTENRAPLASESMPKRRQDGPKLHTSSRTRPRPRCIKITR